MAMKSFLAGCIDRGNGTGNSNQKTGPPGSPGSGFAAYNNTDISGGVIYVNWSDLQPNRNGSLSASQNQNLTGSGSGWTATGINLINFAASEAAAGHRQDGSTGAGPWLLVVRLSCGIYSPSWTIADQCPGSFTYADTSGTPFGTCPAWWTTQYQQSYNILIQKLAAMYDDPTGHSGNDANIVCFTVAGAMNGVYQEPLIRGMGSPGNIAGEAYAGYIPGAGDYSTSGSDEWALQQSLIAHQAFVFTYSDMPYNPYQYWNIGTSQIEGNSAYKLPVNWVGAAPTNTPTNPFVANYNGATTYNKGDAVGYGTTAKVYVCSTNGTVGVVPTTTSKWWVTKAQSSTNPTPLTASLMDQARGILGGKVLLGNNSLRNGGTGTNNPGKYNFNNTGSQDPYTNMYGNLWLRGTKHLNNLTAPANGSGGGSGLKIQTSTGARLGNVGDTLGFVIQTCVDAGINWVELPGGYDSKGNDNNGITTPWYFLPAGTGSQGTHQPLGCADYTTLLQANLQPNAGGGGSVGGGGGTSYHGETSASTTGPGNAQG